jgi:hypothetical protein
MRAAVLHSTESPPVPDQFEEPRAQAESAVVDVPVRRRQRRHCAARRPAPALRVRDRALRVDGRADVPREAFTTMAEHVATGRLTMDVERYDLENVADAWQARPKSLHHKLVITP